MKKTFNKSGARSFSKGGILAGIVIFSFLIRLIYLWQIKATPLFDFFAGDSSFYDLFAMKIAQGDFLYKDSVCLNALYPLFLSVIYFISGHSPAAAAFSQIILDSLTCLSLYFLSVRVFKKETIGLLSAFIYACYSMAIFYTGFLLDVTLVVFLNVLFILLILRARDAKKTMAWVYAGVVLGLITVLKAGILLFIPLLAIWLWHVNAGKNTIRQVFLPVGMMLICAAVVLLPFAAKNYLIEKNFSPFPAQGGFNFFVGNNPLARGTYTPFFEIPDSPVAQAKAFVRLAQEDKAVYPREDGSGIEPMTASDASRYWFNKGLRFIADNKSRYLRLCLKKIFLFFNAEEIQLNANYYFCARFIPALRLPMFSFGLIAPFAALGVVLALRRKERNAYLLILFICGHLAFLCLYYIAARYRMPAVPFMIVLAAYGAFGYAALFRRERLKELFLFSLLLVGSFLVVYKPASPVNSRNDFAVSYNNLGNAYARGNKYDQAVREYLNAIRENPGYAQAHYNLGNVYYLKNMFKEAAGEYRETVRLDPGNGQAHNNLAVYYFYVEKDAQQAREHVNAALQREVEVNPTFLLELFQAQGDSAGGLKKP